MAHHFRKAPFEQALYEVVSDGARDFLFPEPGPINETPPLDAMRHQPARFHFAEHGGDGRIGQIVWRGDLFEHVGDGSFSALPEDLHDTKLEISEFGNFPFHVTTVVILPK